MHFLQTSTNSKTKSPSKDTSKKKSVNFFIFFFRFIIQDTIEFHSHVQHYGLVNKDTGNITFEPLYHKCHFFTFIVSFFVNNIIFCIFVFCFSRHNRRSTKTSKNPKFYHCFNFVYKFTSQQ